VLEGHTAHIWTVTWAHDSAQAFSGDQDGGIRVWNISDELLASQAANGTSTPELIDVQYTNAKVLLVGESGVGKTTLSQVLAGQTLQPSPSTVGAWATQWKLPISPADGIEREIWLWDFGGQADQRLIHQLYMGEAASVVLVFDGQKD